MGSLNALTRVLSALPSVFPAPIVVVRHVHKLYPELISELLGRRISLKTKQAEASDRIGPGWVYMAPPDRHLLVEAGGFLSLDRGPKIEFSRPAADPMFESVARAYKARALGVVLTGSGKDGAWGVQKIKEAGGTVIVQDPASSEAAGMPSAAIATGCADFVLGLEKIPAALVTLTMVRGGAELFGIPPAAPPPAA